MSKENEGAQQSPLGFFDALAKFLRALPQMRTLGWGLLVAWGTVSSFTDVFAPVDTQVFRHYWIANMAATTAIMVLFGSLGTRREQNPWERAVMALSALLIAVSTIVMVFWFNQSSLVAQVVQTCAGVLSGLGMGAGSLCWAMQYARQDAQDIETRVLCSLALMAVVYAVSLILPWALKIVLLVVLPLASFTCFLMNLIEGSADGVSSEDSEDDSSHRLLLDPVNGEFLRTGLSVVSLGCAVSLLWSLVSEGVVALDGTLMAVSLLSGTVVTGVLILYCVTYANRLNLISLYRWLLPGLLLALFFMIGFDQVTRFLGSLCIFAAQMGLDAFTFMYYCETANRSPRNAVRILGFGRAFLQGGILLGAVLAQFVIAGIRDGVITLPGVLLLLGAVVAGCVMLALSDSAAAAQQQPCEEDYSAEDSLPQDVNELARVLFERKCDQVAEQGGLSQRERELLSFLARGRSLPYIRNELYISKSTANTHVEHIYTKLGIHSREELISLVEEAQI